MPDKTLPKTWENLVHTASLLPVIVHSVERMNDESWSVSDSRHDFFEVVYMKKGSALFEIAGEQVQMEPHDMIMIRPSRPHRFFVRKQTTCDFLILKFRFEDRSGGAYSEVSLKDFLDFVRGDETGNYMKLKVGSRGEIVTLLDRIIRERASGDIGSEFLSHLLMLELFVHLSRALKREWEESMRGRRAKIRELVDLSVAYMENHLEESISPGQVARYLFLSHSYFTRIFREETGISPIRHILQLKVEKAMTLLRDTEVRGTDMKMSEIAEKAGFTGQQRFNEIFRKLTGATPTRFRQECRDHPSKYRKL